MRDVQEATARAAAPFLEQLSTRAATKAAHDGTGVTKLQVVDKKKDLASTASAIKEMTAGIRGEKHLQGKHPQKTHGRGGGGSGGGGSGGSDGGISGGPPSAGRTGGTRTPKQEAQITSEMARSAYGSASRGTKKTMESYIKSGDGQYRQKKFGSASSSYRKADSVFQASVRPSKPKKRAQFALYD